MRTPALVEVWLVDVSADAAIQTEALPDGVSADAVSLVATGVCETARIAVVPVAHATAIGAALRRQGARIEIRRAARDARATLDALHEPTDEPEVAGDSLVVQVRDTATGCARLVAAALVIVAVLVGPPALIFWLTGGGDATRDDAPRDPVAATSEGTPADPTQPPEIPGPPVDDGARSSTAAGGTPRPAGPDDAARPAAAPSPTDGATVRPPAPPGAPPAPPGRARGPGARLLTACGLGGLLGLALVAGLQRLAPVSRERAGMRRTGFTQLACAVACLLGLVAVVVGAAGGAPMEPAAPAASGSSAAAAGAAAGAHAPSADAQVGAAGDPTPGADEGQDPDAAPGAGPSTASPATIVAFVDALPPPQPNDIAALHARLAGVSQTPSPEPTMAAFVGALPTPCPTDPPMARLACELAAAAAPSEGPAARTGPAGDTASAPPDAAALDPGDEPAADGDGAGRADGPRDPRADVAPRDPAGEDRASRADEPHTDEPHTDEPLADASDDTTGVAPRADQHRADQHRADAQSADGPATHNRTDGQPGSQPDEDRGVSASDDAETPPAADPSRANDPPPTPGDDGAPAAPGQRPSDRRDGAPTPALAFVLGLLLGGALGFSGRALLALTPRDETPS